MAQDKLIAFWDGSVSSSPLSRRGGYWLGLGLGGLALDLVD